LSRCINNLFHVNFNGNDTQAYQNLEDYIKNILKFIKSNTNKKPIIKLHSSEYFNIAPMIKQIDQNIPIYQHDDLLSILETCDY
jgi:translation initiation factor 2 gamma subunit (eIF-2gamma)